MLGPSWPQVGPQEAPSSFREAPCKLTENFPESLQAVLGGALPWRVLLGWAQPWVGLSWLHLASGLSFPGLVLTFGKFWPHEVELWDGATVDTIKRKPGLVLAFVILPPYEVES